MRGWCRKFLFLLLTSMAALPLPSSAQEVSGRVQQLYGQAESREQAGDLQGAIADYLEIIKVQPTLAAAHNNLGRLYYQQGEFEKAITSLKRASQLDPKLVAPHALAGFVLFQMGDFKGSRQELATAAKLDPKDVNVRLFLARSMIELDERPAALKMLQQLEQEAPNNTEVLYTLGTLYSNLAESTIGKIQTVDPNSYLVEMLLGTYDEIRQVYKDAAEHYRRAIEKAPNVPDLYYRYGRALWLSNDAPGAITQYKKAIELNPYDYRALWELARAELTDNPEEAVKLSTAALSLKPNLQEALSVRGRALLALQKPQDAVADLKKAAALDPQDATVHFQLARAYRQLGMTQEAQAENAAYERLDKAAHAAKERSAAPVQ